MTHLMPECTLRLDARTLRDHVGHFDAQKAVSNISNLSQSLSKVHLKASMNRLGPPVRYILQAALLHSLLCRGTGKII